MLNNSDIDTLHSMSSKAKHITRSRSIKTRKTGRHHRFLFWLIGGMDYREWPKLPVFKTEHRVVGITYLKRSKQTSKRTVILTRTTDSTTSVAFRVCIATTRFASPSWCWSWCWCWCWRRRRSSSSCGRQRRLFVITRRSIHNRAGIKEENSIAWDVSLISFFGLLLLNYYYDILIRWT